MSGLAVILAGIAAEVGAPLIKKILEPKIGASGGALAETVIQTIAEKAGAEPIDLPALDRPSLETAIRQAEAEAPELIAVYAAGLEGQFALLQAETKEGIWQSAWRWGWMYLLAAFWIWRIIVLPVLNRTTDHPIEPIDLAVLMTLTSWFIGLYMGGHTIKELGRSVAEAVKGRKGGLW